MEFVGTCCAVWMVGMAVYFAVRVYLIRRAHRKFMRELDLVNQSTNKAAAAKTTESYEFYMKQASERLDNLHR